jgi:hypothetical protein
MRKKITPKVAKEYVEGYGSECPFCDSEDIVGGETNYGAGEIWQDVLCNSCEKEWVDIYTLTGVEEKE